MHSRLFRIKNFVQKDFLSEQISCQKAPHYVFKNSDHLNQRTEKRQTCKEALREFIKNYNAAYT